MNERLRTGLQAASQAGLSWATRKYQIEARTQFEIGSTTLAAEIDAFNAELDKDPEYNTYTEKWAKKLPELQGMIANTTNPQAKKDLELYLDTMNTRQGVVIEGKANSRLMKDAYVTRTSALDQRLQQEGIPTANKMQDIEGTIQGLFQDGVIDQVKAADMMASLGGIVAGRDLKSQAMAVFRKVEAEQGPEAAMNAADRFIQEFGEAYTVGGQTVSVTAQQKDLARSDLVDSFNIGKRERAAEAEKVFNEEDGRMYSAFSAYINGKEGGISMRMIDGSRLPVERKMYWRSQLEQAENIKKRPDGAEEAMAGDLWNKVNIIKSELKRAGGALTGDSTVSFGGKKVTVRNANGLTEILKDNYALFSKIYGDKWAKMYEDFVKDIDTPVGPSESVRDRIRALTKEKKNPMPIHEADQHIMMADAFDKAHGGKATFEQWEDWFKKTVEAPRLTKLVKQINMGSFRADSDDEITQGFANGRFINDFADGRPINPRTREGIMSYAAAIEKMVVKVEGLKPGTYSTQYTEGKFAGFRMFQGPSSWTHVPMGKKGETGILKQTDEGKGRVRYQLLDQKTGKWKDASPRLDNPKYWDFRPEPKKEDAKQSKTNWQDDYLRETKEKMLSGELY